MRLAVLAIGDELLDGRLQDTNSYFVAKECEDFGVELVQVMYCSDNESQIVTALRYLTSTVEPGIDLVIISGGLGPTTDDLTREALAEILKVELELDQNVLQNLKNLYASRKRDFDPSNTKQATFPRGAKVIHNPYGTAAAFEVLVSNCKVICLPGVPGEFKGLWADYCVPLVSGQSKQQLQQTKHLCVFGHPESKLNSIIGGCNLDTEIQIAYRVQFPCIWLKFKSSDSSLLDAAISKVLPAIGSEKIVCENLSSSLFVELLKLLDRKKLTLGLAESCTGGLLSSLITQVPGASRSFKGSIVVYANSVKEKLAKVSVASLSEFGAVSSQVAEELAQGVAQELDVDCSLSITGVAGPDGGTADKPVGLFYVGCKVRDKLIVKECFFSGTRDRIQKYAAYYAADLLRRILLNCE